MARIVLAMLLFFGAAGPVWSEEAPLRLVDDRGEKIGAPLEVCFQLDLLDLTLRDLEGRPVPNAEVILRRGAVIIPRSLLSNHLAQLGLRRQTDGSGRL